MVLKVCIKEQHFRVLSSIETTVRILGVGGCKCEVGGHSRMRKAASARGKTPRRPYRAVPGCLCCLPPLPRAVSSLPPLPRSLPATPGRRASASTGGKRPAPTRTASANPRTAGGSGNPRFQPLPRGPYALVPPSTVTLSRHIAAQSGTPWPSAEGGSWSYGTGLSISLGSRDQAQFCNDLGTDLISLLAIGTVSSFPQKLKVR